MADSSETKEEQRESSESEVFRRAHDLLFRHPAITQEVFNALVAEGKKFAATPEGARLRQRLLRSDQVARARMFWDVVSLSAFSGNEEGLPSVVVHEIARAAVTDSLEEKLARLFERNV